MRFSISIFYLILLLVLIIAIQVFLSKRKNKWLGLILPHICLMFSFIAVLSMATFSSITSKVTTTDENGQIIEETIEESKNEPMMSTGSMVLSSVAVFCLYNIPTVILVGIYFGCRESMHKNIELEKMNIQDL